MEKYTGHINDRAGNAVAGASVRIVKPDGSEAALYAYSGGPAIPNPVLTDPDGRYAFAAINGKYNAQVSFGGVLYTTLDGLVLYDRDDEPDQGDDDQPSGAAALDELATSNGTTLVWGNWAGDRLAPVSDLGMPSGATLIGHTAILAGAVPRDVGSKLREECTLADFATADEAVMGAAGLRLVIGPTESVTLNVPAQFATIAAAMTALKGWVILGTATIQVADGTYVHAANVNLNHPFGAQIRLVGNETTPANCVIQVAASGFDCFTVSNGHTLGYFNGFKLYKTAKALAADNTTGLLALNGARIICGPKVVVDNWYYGIAARGASYVYAAYASVDHAGDVGIWAFVGSTVDCPYAVSNNAIDSAGGYGFGFQAEYGSAMNCSSASASGCLVGGIASLSNSNVRALSAISNSNTGSGFFARDGATIENHNATANSNTRYGIEEIGSSRITGNGVTVTSNTLGGRKNTAYFDNDTLGARLAANGDLRIDNNATGSTYFNTSGGLQMRVDHTASAVNQFAFTGAATGQPVRLIAAGTDTNIDLQLSTKGTGVVRFGTLTANADAAVTGYITIKDAGGTLRKLAVIA